MRIIGDVHGDYDTYEKITKNCENSIQIGDMGIGMKFETNPNHYSENHMFFRGNHDNPSECLNTPNFLGDYGYKNGVFWLSGAESVDSKRRSEGIDYWANEQLSVSQFESALYLYEKYKPRIVLSHDAPQSIICSMFTYIHKNTLTRQALDAAYQIHQPEYWVFGHHHKTKHYQDKSTKFICLGSLDYIDL